jgi:protease IV
MKIFRLSCGLVAALALSTAACTPKPKKLPDHRVEDDDGDDDEGGLPEVPGGLGGSFGMMGSLLAQNAGQPGPYDEPRKSPGFSARKPHAVVLELEGEVVELAAMNLFGGGGPTVELRALLDKLTALAGDDDVTALVVRLGDLSLPAATAEELRAGLVAFKGDGARQVLCHTEGAANLAYYVLTACDQIGLAPTGGIAITGAAAMPVHLKAALDKLGVKADFLHVGAFKGAAEPLTRDRPSPEMVETLNGILDQTYDTLVAGIAEGRGLEPAAVRGLIDRALFHGDEAVAARLADQVDVFERWREAALAGGAWQVVKLEQEPGLGRLMELVGLAPRRRPSGDRVALVYAVGEVVDGKGDGLLGARQEIASRPLASALRVLAADDAVKAIVLRVDSPGGSALASEIIWHAVGEARAKKPVVVSMGPVAASGGYYISAGATRIFADANTLTGSIGVVGGKLALGGALDKLGVASFPMGRGKRALMWSALSPWNADERAAVQQMMQSIYDVFLDRVASGRGKQPADIHPLAQGRVWTGKAALERGLVDEIGGLQAALAFARAEGKVGERVPLEVYPPEPTLLDFLSSFGQASLPLGLDAAVAQVEHHLGRAAGRTAARLLRQALRFEREPVQTVWLDAPVLE